MKQVFTLLLLAMTFVYGYAQDTPPPTPPPPTPPPGADQPGNTQLSASDFGWSQRFAFIIGGGPSAIGNSLYQDPSVDRSTKVVIIEKSEKIKTNLSLGIVYTPYVFTIKRSIEVKGADGQITEETFLEYYPKGITFGLFMNPISLTTLSDNTFTNSVDLGLGVGWRSGSFALLLTSEFFGVRQPKDYFVKTYKDNDKPYIVDGQTQVALDVNDNSIFKTKIVTAFGLKMCYTFDLAKSFYANSKTITDQRTDSE